MKGIAHFAIGVAAATCFPETVRAGAAGCPLYTILGGACGLLPDTLDFKLTRFLYHTDVIITPDPNAPDAAMIADGIAQAITMAIDENRAIDLKLNTIQLGADRWQRYTVSFDVPKQCVVVTLGPQVDTGGRPLPDGSGDSAGESTAAQLPARLLIEYLADTTVDIFDGPVFRFEPQPDGRVRAAFIPWHRSWTHSFVIALLVGLVCTAVWTPVAGAVAFAGYAAHILADQTGYMGSNLFAPFSKHRTRGLRWAHSGTAMANFACVWISGWVVFWNLYQGNPATQVPLDPLRVLIIGIGLPLAAFYALQRLAARSDDG